MKKFIKKIMQMVILSASSVGLKSLVKLVPFQVTSNLLLNGNILIL